MKKLILLIGLFLLPVVLNYQISGTLKKAPPQLEMCSLCVQTMSETIQELLDIILNVGVVGSCGTLCQYLVPKFGKIVAEACDIICDIAGIDLFIKLIQKADLDPIWMCQEIKLCPVDDCKLDVCAKFLEPTVVRPNPGTIGGEVQFMYQFQIMAKTGTGEIMLAIHTSKGSDPPVIEGGELVPKGYEPGKFQAAMQVKFQNDESAEPPVIFQPGLYEAHFYICEGQCGSKHPHTRTLAYQYANFTMQN